LKNANEVRIVRHSTIKTQPRNKQSQSIKRTEKQQKTQGALLLHISPGAVRERMSGRGISFSIYFNRSTRKKQQQERRRINKNDEKCNKPNETKQQKN
jgi:hypothetical protein